MLIHMGKDLIEKELIPNIEIPKLKDGESQLSIIINALKEKGYSFDNSQAVFQSATVQPGLITEHNIPQRITIDIYPKDALPLLTSTVSTAATEEATPKQKKARTRSKEGKIGEIIEKVVIWRSLYNGEAPPPYNQKYSLEEAAAMVKMSRKSLDDYLLQLRYGKKFQYNFDANKDKGFGELRKYIKEKQKEELQFEPLLNKTLSGETNKVDT